MIWGWGAEEINLAALLREKINLGSDPPGVWKGLLRGKKIRRGFSRKKIPNFFPSISLPPHPRSLMVVPLESFCMDMGFAVFICVFPSHYCVFDCLFVCLISCVFYVYYYSLTKESVQSVKS